MDLSLTLYLVALPLAFVAGLVNAAVGGGGLITVPGLFAAAPTAAPALLLGTDKASAVFGHAAAMRHYARRIDLEWRLIALASAVALVGGLIGAAVVRFLPGTAVRPLVIGLIAVMFVYTLVRPDFGSVAVEAPAGALRRAIGVGLLFAVGFYDGVFGPGTGSFLVFVFVRVFRFDFLRATASAKFVNLAADCGALLLFAPTGAISWPLAIPMGLAALAGGRVGAALVMRGGNRLIRRIFLGLAAVLLLKLVWETLR